MAEDKIPGISEFCDRWCERCAFKHRCEDYPSGKSPMDELTSNPMLVESNLEKAMKKIETSFEVENLDVYQILAKANQEKIARKAQTSLPQLSAEYSEMTKKWLRSQPGMLDRLEKLKEELTMGMESIEAGKSTAESIKNALAVIHWDEPLIHSKLEKAVAIKLDDAAAETDSNKSDGFAKVALISIERSLESWQMLFELLPDREDDFLSILAQLQKLQEALMKEFPDVKNFKRPGFDD
jgi:hypothetical protein